LRDVLNWQTREVAEFLETTELAVNSALLRGRATLRNTTAAAQTALIRRNPEQVAALLTRYVQAWETRSIDQLLALLKEDALVTMPPMPVWYQGHAALGEFFRQIVFKEAREWKIQPIAANGQAAFALYQQQTESPDYRLAGIQLITLAQTHLARIDHYLIGQIPDHSTLIVPTWLRFFQLPTVLNNGL
jgi:RNA polymerase sigma-70 factor (ECF subfamily)